MSVARLPQAGEGALGASSDVIVQRDVAGLVRVGRPVYDGDWGRPRVEWLDAHAVRVGGHPIDIYRDPAVDGCTD